MLNFFQKMKCWFAGLTGLFELVVLEKIIICLIFVILLLCLIFTPSFWVGLALFVLFLWAIVF